METRKTLKRASESSVFVLSCTKTSGDKSLSFICYNDISGKMHRDNWNGKILCLKRWISLQKFLWCAIYWWVIHRQVIVIKNYWHVPPSVNLWRHEKQKCDISGSTRHTKSMERRQYTTLLTFLSKYISLAILCNRALFTSRLPENAEYLELCARQFHSKSTFWLTRLLRLEKERMRPSATPIIIFSITDSGRPTCVSTLTTALARIKTIFFYGTWPGELWWTRDNTILYSFLIVGHTKFGPDHCFGRIKKSYKLIYVLSIYELASLVEKSSTTGNNKAQIVGTHDGRVIVPVYDWASFLEPYFKKIPNIKKYHHFRFSKATPGMAFCKELVTSPEQPFMLVKDQANLPPSSVLPPTIRPDGLSQERKNYLFREIRQFCKPGTEDLVAPAPWTVGPVALFA